jgi:hypothetical protein
MTRPGVWFDSCPGQNIFFFIASKQLRKSVYLPIRWVLGTPFSEVKRPGRDADHSPLSSAISDELKYILASPYVFRRGVSLINHGDIFNCYVRWAHFCKFPSHYSFLRSFWLWNSSCEYKWRVISNFRNSRLSSLTRIKVRKVLMCHTLLLKLQFAFLLHQEDDKSDALKQFFCFTCLTAALFGHTECQDKRN